MTCGDLLFARAVDDAAKATYEAENPDKPYGWDAASPTTQKVQRSLVVPAVIATLKAVSDLCDGVRSSHYGQNNEEDRIINASIRGTCAAIASVCRPREGG